MLAPPPVDKLSATLLVMHSWPVLLQEFLKCLFLGFSLVFLLGLSEIVHVAHRPPFEEACCELLNHLFYG